MARFRLSLPFLLIGLLASGCGFGGSGSISARQPSIPGTSASGPDSSQGAPSSSGSSIPGASSRSESSESSIPGHIHTYESAWSHDEKEHWHASTCGHDVRGDVEPHAFVLTSERPATYDEEGSRTYACSVCGYEYEEEVEKLVHRFSADWSHDEEHHWHACLDEGFEDLRSDYGAHVLEEVEVEPDYDHEGYVLHRCTTCDYEYKTDIVDQLHHTYATSWSYDETGHYHACTDEGYEDLRADFDPHVLGDWTISDEVDAEGYSRKVRRCEVCGYELQSEEKANGSIPHLTFKKRGETYHVVGFDDRIPVVRIPGEYNGLPVVAIADTAFAYTHVRAVFIEEGITEIGVTCFRHVRELRVLVCPSTLDTFAGNSLGMARLSYVEFNCSKITLSDASVWGASFSLVVAPSLSVRRYLSGETANTANMHLSVGSIYESREEIELTFHEDGLLTRHYKTDYGEGYAIINNLLPKPIIDVPAEITRIYALGRGVRRLNIDPAGKNIYAYSITDVCRTIEEVYDPGNHFSRSSTDDKTAITTAEEELQTYWMDRDFFVRDDGKGTLALLDYTGTDKVVHVPEGITAIRDSAFSRNHVIEEAYLPDSLTIIEESAFCSCSKLRFIDYGEGLPWLHAVEDCPALTTVAIPENIKGFSFADLMEGHNIVGKKTAYILEVIYTGTLKLDITSEMTVLDSREKSQLVLDEGGFLFKKDTATLARYLGDESAVTVPEGVTTILPHCFVAAMAQEVNLGDSIQKIGDYAFPSATTSITFGDDLSAVARDAFAYSWCGLYTRYLRYYVDYQVAAYYPVNIVIAKKIQYRMTDTAESGVTIIAEGMNLGYKSVSLPETLRYIGKRFYGTLSVTTSYTIVYKGRKADWANVAIARPFYGNVNEIITITVKCADGVY